MVWLPQVCFRLRREDDKLKVFEAIQTRFKLKEMFNENLPKPHSTLQISVIIPARNEADRIERILGSLENQEGIRGTFEVIILCNNCCDRSADIARAFSLRNRALMHVLEVDFPPERSHVGSARKILMDLASDRLHSVGNPDGMIASTDADSVPAVDWIMRLQNEMASGIDGVAGFIEVDFSGEVQSHSDIEKYHRLYENYEALRYLLACAQEPIPHAPGPRHGLHAAANLAIRAGRYRAIGGLLELPSDEDADLFRRVVRSGGLFRQSVWPRVKTSGRQVGRVARGLASSLRGWHQVAMQGGDYLVESPDILMKYYEGRARLRKGYIQGVAELLRIPGIDNESLRMRINDGNPLEYQLLELDRSSHKAPLRVPTTYGEAVDQFSRLGFNLFEEDQDGSNRVAHS